MRAVDCFTREVVRRVVSRRCRTADTLEALKRAVESRFPGESTLRRAESHLRRDHGSRFASRAYVDTLNTLGLIGELTHCWHPDGNGFVGRLFDTLKGEEIWCGECPDFESAKEAIDRFIAHFDVERPHSAPGYRALVEVGTTGVESPRWPKTVNGGGVQGASVSSTVKDRKRGGSHGGSFHAPRTM